MAQVTSWVCRTTVSSAVIAHYLLGGADSESLPTDLAKGDTSTAKRTSSSSCYEPKGITNKEMFYGTLPPETNSFNMYAGPGQDSMEAAAQAWLEMHEEFERIPPLFKELCGFLKVLWLGPSGERIAEVTAPFQTWLEALVQQINRTSNEAFNIMVDYLCAYGATVHPRLIAINRARMQQLVADNALGQHVTEIADLDRQYREYWDQDVDVMRTYNKQVSRALRELPSWKSPPSLTNGTGLTEEAAAV